ncbi:uncharacterized protein LOC124935006 [Impatiens glandulifera]|uniref:uncharacterized protein LOC124935006 n=1 Tax=Impatiens glandulifera TaxID=253017 RepID=UPI001FB06351|nr:uncharacterized protein LOC124935006 [Impatiens glandulifera]
MAARGNAIPDLTNRPHGDGMTAVEAAALNVPRSNWHVCTTMPTYDLLNGDIHSITPLLIKPPLDPMYHWVKVAGHHCEDAMFLMDAYIRSHFVHIMTTKPAFVTDAIARKMAIVLGVVRAVSTGLYSLTDANLIPEETREPIYNAVKTQHNEGVMSVLPGWNGGQNNLLTISLNFTPEEQAAITAIVHCAAGVIPIQGYNLIKTGHNYLSTAEGACRKAVRPAEMAYLSGAGAWYTEDQEKIQDWLWHKSTHPVTILLKYTAAMDITISEKLRNAGSGACASRLPTFEPSLNEANIVYKLLATVAPMLDTYGGGIDTHELAEMIEVVNSYKPLVQNPPVPPCLPAKYANVITNRASAIEILDKMVKSNLNMICWAYGFYCAHTDKGPIARDTLRMSPCLKRLSNKCNSMYNEGINAYSAYEEAQAKRRATSVFVAPRFSYK